MRGGGETGCDVGGKQAAVCVWKREIATFATFARKYEIVLGFYYY